MKFDEALPLIRAGKRVRRAAWADDIGTYLYMGKEGGKRIIVSATKYSDPQPPGWNEGQVGYEWCPKTTDVLEEDWEIVE